MNLPIYGTILFDPIRDERQCLTDLSIRWADEQAQRFFSFHAAGLPIGSRFSSFIDKAAVDPHAVFRQLNKQGSATGDIVLTNGQVVRFRMSALNDGFVTLLELVDTPALPRVDYVQKLRQRQPESVNQPIIQQDDMLRRLFDNMPGGLTVWEAVQDADGPTSDFRPLLVNPSMAFILNQDPEQLLSQSLLTLFPDLSGTDLFKQLTGNQPSGPYHSIDYEYRLDGQTKWLDLAFVQIADSVLLRCQDSTTRKRMELDVARRLELESLIATVSSRLINIHASALDACIHDALQQIGQYNQADRAYLSVYSEDQQFMTCLYEWCAPGIEPLKPFLQNQPVVQFSWWADTIQKDQVITIRSLDALPPEAAEVKAGLQAQGVMSILSIPMQYNSYQQGVIGFTTVRQERHWDDRDLGLLRTFSGIITSALQRQQNELAVERAYQRLQGLHAIDKALLKGSLTGELPAVTALQHINDLIPCERLMVFRLDYTTGLAHAEGRLVNGHVEPQPNITVPARYFQTKTLLAGKTAIIQEISPDNSSIPPAMDLYGRGFRSLVVIPLFSHDQYMGAFILLANKTHFFTEEYLKVAREVARQLAIALYQQQLREQVQQHTELLEQRVAERTAEITQLSIVQNAILEHAGLAIMSTDAAGLMQTINPAAEQLLGYQADELIGKIYPRLLPNPDGLETSPKLVSFQFDQPSGTQPDSYLLDLSIIKTVQIDCLLLTKGGRYVSALLVVSTLHDEVGAISGYIGMATDITAIKTARAELETFFEGSLDLHCIAEADGTLLKINRSWESTLGYSKAELRSRNIIELVHPDDHAATINTMRQVLNRLPGNKMVNRLRKKEGGYCTIEWNIIAHENLLYASARDITEQRKAEEQVRSANQRLQLATEAARQGIWELDLNDYTLFWDERQHEMHGTSADSFGGTMNDFLALVHPEDKVYMQNLGLRMANLDELIGTEKRIIRPDGQLRYLETHSKLVLGESGKPEKMVGVSWDVTKRKQTELNLRQSEERYRTLVNNLGDIVFQTDLDGRWTFLNPAWEAITGFTVEESLGQPFITLINPVDRPLTQRLFEEILEERKVSLNYIIQYQHKNGQYRWTEVFAHVMLDNDCQPIGVAGTLTDITERKQTLDALRDSEQRFREFAENIDTIFWIHEANPFKLLYVNPAYEHLWGQSCQSLYDDVSSFLNPILDDDKPLVINTFYQYINGGDGSIEYRLRDSRASIRWVRVRTFVTRDMDGTPLRYVGIANDITDQKEKELVLQQSLQREQELNKLKSQFVSTASHEFRTPLSTIQSSVDLIKLYLNRPKASSTSSVERHLGVIENEITNLSELLSDILMIGRIDAGKIAFNAQWTDVIALTQDVIATHFHKSEHTRTIHLQIEGEPRPIYLDDRLIAHVLVNLLSNAFKFSQKDPRLQITFQDESLHLAVIDEGIGIPTDDLPHLFESFFRARNAINIPGSGLGLIIARQFTELHGGTIQVQSEEMRGTTFTVTLPIAPNLNDTVDSHTASVITSTNG